MNATDILGQLLGAGQKGGGSLNTGAGAKVLEDLLGVGTGNQSGGNQRSGQGGGVFGGGQTGGATSGGNAGGTVGQQNTGTASGGGLGGALGGGGLGDLLGKALKELGRAQGGPQQAPGAGNNSPFGQTPQQAPQISQTDQSAVYIRAMIQAGLSDGRLDEQEQQAIVQKVGNMGQEEQNFIRSEMAKGLDVNAFIQTVPRGIEEEVYAVSLMAIQLDNRQEAQFLDSVAKGLRITQEQSNAIHDRFGVQRLYG